MTKSFECNRTSYINNICPKCGKPPYYVGDVPEGGFIVGAEPYCTCGTAICPTCGKRYAPKCKECGK